jgi:hypothetical protein
MTGLYATMAARSVPQLVPIKAGRRAIKPREAN